MKPNRPEPLVASAWLGSVVAATLLGGACVAPEFDKIDSLQGIGGAGGTTTTSTTLGSGDTQATSSAAATTQSSSGSGGSSGTAASTSTASTNGGAGGNTVTLTTAGGSGGVPPTCAAGETVCDAECVSIDSNVAHCGSCGTACSALEECIGGGCECVESYTECASGCAQTDSDSQNCGSCGNACDPGEVCSQGVCRSDCADGLRACNGSCVDVDTNRQYCGSCYIACDPGFSCAGGKCVCDGGLTDCNSTCYDTNTSELHCGGCFQRCGTDQTCSGGSCVCNGAGVACDYECVDTDTDAAHCGGCGQACSERESCSGGSCVCTDGYERCSGSCVVLDDDPDNCGSCGNSCGSGQVCRNGSCCNVSMLLLGDEDTTGNAAMRTAYQDAGMTVTLIDGGTSSYAGSPDAEDFQVVVASFGRTTADVGMPQAGQDAIAAAHAGGTGYVAFELAAWQQQAGLNPTLAPLTLMTYGTTIFSTGLVTLTSAGHPIWDGVPTSFTPALGLSTTVGNILNGGVPIAACAGCEYGDQYYGAAVVVRDTTGGRIVHFTNEGNESDVHLDPNFVKISVNAALWAASCQ